MQCRCVSGCVTGSVTTAASPHAFNFTRCCTENFHARTFNPPLNAPPPSAWFGGHLIAKLITFAESECTSSTVDDGGTSGDGRRRTTAYFIGEGVHGCFKDRVLCDVNYEPCPVSPKQLLQEESSPPRSLLDTEAVGFGEQQLPTAIEEAEEDAMVMGPSGLPTDVVARKRLPRWLAPGDWLYFSRMGAYTASIATISSSAALHASYCYVAGTPSVVVAADVGDGVEDGGCVRGGAVDRETQ